MLITDELQVTLHGANIKHYEDLGYEIPRAYNRSRNDYLIKKGTKIKVKVSDLSKNSNEKVDVVCDYCGNVVQKTYKAYLESREIVQKDCCVDCKSFKNKEVAAKNGTKKHNKEEKSKNAENTKINQRVMRIKKVSINGSTMWRGWLMPKDLMMIQLGICLN